MPAAMGATQRALIRLERWSKYSCFLLKPSKCESTFFSVDPQQANLQPNLLLLNYHLRFNSIPTSLGITFTRILFFSKRVSLLPHGAPLTSPSLFSIELFFGPFSHMLHLDGFRFSSLPKLPSWNVFIERLVAPSPAASRPLLSHFCS